MLCLLAPAVQAGVGLGVPTITPVTPLPQFLLPTLALFDCACSRGPPWAFRGRHGTCRQRCTACPICQVSGRPALLHTGPLIVLGACLMPAVRCSSLRMLTPKPRTRSMLSATVLLGSLVCPLHSSRGKVLCPYLVSMVLLRWPGLARRGGCCAGSSNDPVLRRPLAPAGPHRTGLHRCRGNYGGLCGFHAQHRSLPARHLLQKRNNGRHLLVGMPACCRWGSVLSCLA